MRQLVDQAAAADKHVRILPYDTDYTRARCKPPQHVLTANMKGLPSNLYLAAFYWAHGFLYSLGNQSQFQIIIETSIDPDKFIELFNAQAKANEADELDIFLAKKHPIQNMDTTCIGSLPGTTPNTDCELLAKEPQKAINKILQTTDNNYILIYVQYLNIQLNQQECKDICKAIKKFTYIPAVHIFVALQDYKRCLKALCQIYHPKKKTDFPVGIKYEFVVASNSKGFRGNRMELEATIEVIKQEQAAFLASLETEICLQCNKRQSDEGDQYPHAGHHIKLPDTESSCILEGSSLNCGL